MSIARAPDRRTIATAPRPGAVAMATIVSSPPGSAASPDTGYPFTSGFLDRSCEISHCCGSDARFCTK